MDDSGIKYKNIANVHHLHAALKQQYKIKSDPTSALYWGLTLDWNYKNGYVDVSMPGYREKILHRWSHPKPNKQQHSPYEWSRPVYGAKVQ